MDITINSSISHVYVIYRRENLSHSVGNKIWDFASSQYITLMFYSDSILCRKGPLAVIWLAAHWERKLTKQQITSTDISASIQELDHMPAMALRLKGQLLLGMTRIYGKKAIYLAEDCNETMDRMKDHIPNQSSISKVVSTTENLLPKEQATISLQGSTMSNLPISIDLLMHTSMIDMDAIMQHHTSKHDIPLPISQRHHPASPMRASHAEAPDIENIITGLEFDPNEFPQWEELVSYENLSQDPKRPKLNDDDIEVPRGSPIDRDIELPRRAPSLDNPPRLSDIVINDQFPLETQHSPAPKETVHLDAIGGFEDGGFTIPNPLQDTPTRSHSPQPTKLPVYTIEHQPLQNPFKIPNQTQRKHKRSQPPKDNRLLLDSEIEISGHTVQTQLKDTSDITDQIVIRRPTDLSTIYEKYGINSKIFNELHQDHSYSPKPQPPKHKDIPQDIGGFDQWNEEQPLIDMEIDPMIERDKIDDQVLPNISLPSESSSTGFQVPDILAPLLLDQSSFRTGHRLALKQLIKDSMSKSFGSLDNVKRRRFVSMSFLSILERANVDKKIVLEQPDGPFKDIFITVI